MRKPLALDLCCGLGGWADGLLSEGWDVVGIDIEKHVYGDHRYPAGLIIQDVLTVSGSAFSEASLIVASPPCQFFSYTAMPWSRAKALAAEVRADPARLVKELAIFHACFRIQREASEAAGRHIPMVVENVKGAQPWIGRARWSFGSFYLWGDVPALMPTALGRKNSGGSWFAVAHNTTSGHGQNPDGRNVAGFRFDGSGRSFQSASVAETEGRKHGGDWFSDPTCPSRQGGQRKRNEGMKQPGINLSAVGFNVANALEFGPMVAGAQYHRSEDDKRSHIGVTRKFASAMIAKIPEPLSRHIARVFYPRELAERVA